MSYYGRDLEQMLADWYIAATLDEHFCEFGEKNVQHYVSALE